MKRFLFLTFVFVTFVAFAASAKDPALKYDIASAGSSHPGVALVKVSVYQKSSKLNADELKEAAVRGVVFKGYNDDQWGNKKPLVSSISKEKEFADFFDMFFSEGGEYLNYAQQIDGSIDRVKLSKGEYKYKISAVVSVSETELKKALQDAGVAKSMTSGF